MRTERLDDALPDGLVPRLIKVDVEGAELLGMLRGAQRTIARHRPSILFEHGIGAADRYGYGPGELSTTSSSATSQMRIFDLDGAGPVRPRAIRRVFPEPPWNFLAVP